MQLGAGKAVVTSTVLAVALVFCSQALAYHVSKKPRSTYHLASGDQHRNWRSSSRVIQCVAFAKSDAGIDISGNARDWWGNAAGVYERGARPEEGSVLSFRENGRMPLGHVAVVSGISDSRTIVIDQSHWGSRGITRDITVKDVSQENDWTAVRVQLANGRDFGSIYPTHGFIYPRPDHGRIVANLTHAPLEELDPAPADLRHSNHSRSAPVEVAEAPDLAKPLDLSMPGISADAPSRALR